MKINVIERKLGREKAWGLAWESDKKIEIDVNQPPKEHLNTVIHECLHIVLPELTEKEVIKYSNTIAGVLWKMKYRRIKE